MSYCEFVTSGTQARIERDGNEVILTFVADNPEMADRMARVIIARLQAIAIDITMTDKEDK